MTGFAEAFSSGDDLENELIQSITGMGGVGKTQAAVEYSHRHADNFDVVWWLRCEHSATLANDFAALAEPLDLPEKDAPNQQAAIDAVRRWLEGHDRWLLVFDDAADPDELELYLPCAVAGQIRVTSRNPDWDGVAAPLHVELFVREESIEYLLKRHERTVAGTFRLSMEQARQKCAHADALLKLCAFLAPEDLPLDLLLEECTDGLPDELLPLFDDEIRSQATAALCQYSLLERRGDSLLIHRPVQAVTIESLSATDCKRWTEAAIKVLNKHLGTDVETNLSSWPV